MGRAIVLIVWSMTIFLKGNFVGDKSTYSIGRCTGGMYIYSDFLNSLTCACTVALEDQ